jgi:hypothetical protein
VCRVVPYIAGHVIAVMYVIAAWRWPRAAGFITGVGFVFAGGFNIWTACTSPGTYVQAFGPHALAPYRAFHLRGFRQMWIHGTATSYWWIGGIAAQVLGSFGVGARRRQSGCWNLTEYFCVTINPKGHITPHWEEQ